MLDAPITHLFHSQGGRKQTDRYVIPEAALTLQVSGIDAYKIRGREIKTPLPFLVLHPPGTEIELGNTPTRHSWSIRMRTDEVRASTQEGLVEIRCDGNWIALPAVTPLSEEECAWVEAEFTKINPWFASPVPAHQFRARLGFIGLLRHIVDAFLAEKAETPAAAFKRLMDSDEKMKHSLDDLGKQCGYSANHLRVLFEKEFGLSPLAYRNHVRMLRALMLVQNSSLPLKVIASRMGFRHFSHFSRMFRKAFNKSPRQVPRQKRIS